MKQIAVTLILMFAGWTAFSAQTGAAKGKSTPKTSSRSASTKSKSTKSTKAASGKTYAKGKTTQKSNTYRGRKSAQTAARRTYVQNEPTPDRYREIQQALAERGYLRSDPSGRWDPESTDALRRFQQDQNLEASGKLDSLSLIALGLGPKRTASAQARPQ